MRGVTPQTPYVPGPSPVRPEEPFTLQQMAPRRSSRWMLWLVAGLVVLGLTGTGAAFWMSGEPARESGPSQTQLVDQCREAVRPKLKAPSTAQFPGGEKVESSGTTYRVFGQVDAQNSFGAMLRTDYRCVATLDGAEWDVYSVEVS